MARKKAAQGDSAGEEPKMFTYAEGWEKYEDGHKAGRASLWSEQQEYAGIACGIAFGVFAVVSIVYTSASILAWLFS